MTLLYLFAVDVWSICDKTLPISQQMEMVYQKFSLKEGTKAVNYSMFKAKPITKWSRSAISVKSLLLIFNDL